MTQRDMAVTAILVRVWHGGKFPMLFRTSTNFRDKPEWAPPIGHVERGETPKQAVVRELREELGIEVDEADLRHVHTQYRPKHDSAEARTDLYFDVDRFTGTVKNAEPDKHEKLQWFSPRRLPHNTMPHVFAAFDAIARGEEYSELRPPWLETNGYVNAAEGGS